MIAEERPNARDMANKHERDAAYWHELADKLESADARDTLVQGRNRRNMASRLLPPSPHIQAQKQSGERE